MSDVDRNDNSNPQQGYGPPVSSFGVEKGMNAETNSSGSFSAQAGRSLAVKDSRKLFVGGLPQNITNEEFAEFFAQYGQILDCTVMFDRETGRSRGFGFVTYVDPEVSSLLLTMGNNGDDKIGRLLMGDKTVEIKAAEPRPASRGRRGNFGAPTNQNNRINNDQIPYGQFSNGFPPQNFEAPVFMPDGSMEHAYYPSYDATGAYMPGIYGSIPPSDVQLQPRPGFVPVGPVAIPVGLPVEGMGPHPLAMHMVPPHQPPPSQPMHGLGAAAAIPPQQATELPSGTTVLPPQQPFYYAPVIPVVGTNAAMVPNGQPNGTNDTQGE